jgi:hypothetical protein
LLLIKNKTIDLSFWPNNLAGFYSFPFFAGLIILSFLSSWLCLIVPLNFFYLLALSVFPLSVLVIKRKTIGKLPGAGIFRFNFSPVEIAFITICILIFLVAGVIKPVNSDTLTYHIQIIRWMNEYGTVSGVANLFPRFGLGSNWFNLISFFDAPFFNNKNFTWLNTTVVIWFFIWLIGKWKQQTIASSIAGTVMAHFYLLIILFCLFEWELFRDASNSTNYDFVVTSLTIMAVSFLIESILFLNRPASFSIFFIVLCLSIIPFKLSGLFILLLIFFYLSAYKIKKWIVTGIIAIAILLPLLIKNFIITGYPLYPVAWSPAHPDWQVPAEMTNYLRYYIHVSNRFYNSNSVDFTHLPEMMDKNWINEWIKGILVRQKIILALSLTSVLLFFFKTQLKIDYKKLRLLFAILFLMAIGWFLTAPSPRFGYGVLIILAFFPACFFLGQRFLTMLHKPILIFTFFIACSYLYYKSNPIINNPSLLLHTENPDQPPLKKIRINGIDFFLPEVINNRWMRDCFATDLPCICNENKYLEPRGKKIKDGFKMKTTPDSVFFRHYLY